MIKKFKLISFIIFFVYQTSAYSKTIDSSDFNYKYLSNYLSAIISKNNLNSDSSVKFFNSSKILINKHQKFLEQYIIALTINGRVHKSINIVRQNNSNFFEAKLLLLIDNFKKKNFDQNIELLNELKDYKDYSNYQYVIYEVLKDYNDLFITKKNQSR